MRISKAVDLKLAIGRKLTTFGRNAKEREKFLKTMLAEQREGFRYVQICLVIWTWAKPKAEDPV